MGYATGGLDGAKVAVTHLLADAARDRAVTAGGSEAADLGEAIFNYLVAQNGERRKGRRRRSHGSRQKRLRDSA